MLAWGLWMTGFAGYPHEYLHNEKHMRILCQRWDVHGRDEYLQTLINKRTSKNGVFGLKSHFYQFKKNLNTSLIRKYFRNARYIYITRKNHIAQAVSFAKALQTRKWAFEEKSVAKPVYRFNEVQECLKQIAQEETMWESYFRENHISPLRINYEEFVEHYEKTIKDVLSHIGVKNDLTNVILSPETKKMSDEINAEWCKRFKKDSTDMQKKDSPSSISFSAKTPSDNFDAVKYHDMYRIKNKMAQDEKKSDRLSDLRGRNLIFLISQPRAGSTMLQRVLAGHSKIDTTSEPWIMLHPIFALKQRLLKAPFEPHLAEIALEDFVNHFPEKMELFFQAVRHYAQTFYRRCLQKSKKSFFLDKTPRYYMIIPELARCFPDAKFVLLIRHPMAVLSSMLVSWFKNNPHELQDSRNYNDLTEAPKMLLDGIKLLGKRGYVVHYENLVQQTEIEISRLCQWLNVEFEPDMLCYGKKKFNDGRLGDKIEVLNYDIPVKKSIDKWKVNLSNPDLYPFAREVISKITPEICRQMGYNVYDFLNAPAFSQHHNPLACASKMDAKRPNVSSRLVPIRAGNVKQSLAFPGAIITDKSISPITLLLPTKNSGKGLNETLSSVSDAMQDLSYEIILYADKESESINNCLKKYEIRKVFYDHQIFEEKEPFCWSKMMNHGFEQASGKWIMYGSDDIVFHPGCFKSAISLLEQQNDANIGGVTFLHRNTSETYNGFFEDFGYDTLNGDKPFINFGLIKAEAFKKTNGFDQGFRFFWADVDMCLQILDHGFTIVPSIGSLVDHNNILEEKQKQKRIELFENDTDYFFSKWNHNRWFNGTSPLEKVRFFLDESECRYVMQTLKSMHAELKKSAGLRKLNVVIDGVIFQLQARKPMGISRVWRNLIPRLERMMLQANITLLQRNGFNLPFESDNILTVPSYRLGDATVLDHDDEMLARTCRDLGADLFISTYFTRAPGVRNIVMIHDLIPEKFNYDLSLPEWASKQRAIETADAFICVSKTTQQDLVESYPLATHRPMLLAYHGLEDDFKTSSADQIKRIRNMLQLDSPYVLLVGNRQGYKNGVAALTSLAAIDDEDKPVVLCVGGEQSPSIAEKRLQERLDIRYAGYLDDHDLTAAYGGALALLVPSRYEGFGLPVIEAMACGCPVIAHESSAVAEIGAEAVCRVDMNCADDLCNALKMISQKSRREAFIQKGYERIKKFDWSNTTQNIVDFVTKPTAQPSILLTAIVSTYNASDHIQGCLEDLEAQTIADCMEIIVVDSGSKQDEASVVRDFQSRYPNIKYIRTPVRETVYQAWNRGIKFARGKYVSNANTDDRHRHDAFERMVHVLEHDESIALVYADVIKTRTANETFRHCTPAGMFHWHDWDRSTLLERGCFIGPQPVWRKAVHREYGYFDESYEVSADFEFWLRISQTNQFYHIAQPLGLYLDRPDSIEHASTKKKEKEDHEILQRYRQAAKENRVIGMPFPGDSHPGSKGRQVQQAEAAHAVESVQQKKATNEELIQGGHDMHSPETIFTAIKHLVENGYKEAALWAMGKLLADFPKNARLHNEMATLAYEQTDMRSALLHFKEAAALDPENTVYLKNLGDYYYVQEKDAESALTQYERILNLDPANVEALVMAGHVSISLHRYSQAQDYYQRVLKSDPQNMEIRQILEKMSHPALDQNTRATSVDDLYDAAQSKVREGDTAAAISLLEQLLALDDTHALAHNDLGVLQYENGNLQASLGHYEKATALQPENETFQKNLADFYLAALGDSEKAMQTYVQVLKLNPRDVEALLSCAQVCMSIGKLDDAGDFIQSALETEPWNENAQAMQRQLGQPSQLPDAVGTDLYDQAKAKASQGDLQGAIDDLSQYLAATPHNANAHNDLGVLCFEAGDKDKAVAAYEQAVQLEPNEPTYLKNLGDFYLIEQGRTEEAMALYLRVLEKNPQDIESLIASGMVCASLGRMEDAKLFYGRVLEIEPWNEIARKALNGLNPTGAGDDSEIASSAAAGR
jgi:tetratricopeptide (TPR) repeat protein/LPS sulfotransferase NodH/GT2 family glycosyltransferase